MAANAYIDVIVHLDDRVALPPMRIAVKDAGMIPDLVRAQVVAAEHVRQLAVQQLLTIDEESDQ